MKPHSTRCRFCLAVVLFCVAPSTTMLDASIKTDLEIRLDISDLSDLASKGFVDVTNSFGVPIGEDPSLNCWRGAKQCGINCLFLYLHLQDVHVDRQALVRDVEITDMGSSLGALADIANKNGAASSVVWCRVDDFKRIQTPCIAHLSGVESGHFVIVLGMQEQDGERYLLIADATQCRVQRTSISEFARQWSGYLLIPDDGRQAMPTRLVVSVLFASVFALQRLRSHTAR